MSKKQEIRFYATKSNDAAANTPAASAVAYKLTGFHGVNLQWSFTSVYTVKRIIAPLSKYVYCVESFLRWCGVSAAVLFAAGNGCQHGLLVH